MDKTLKKFDQEIVSLSNRSDQLQQRKAETETRLNDVRERIPAVQQMIMDAFVSGADLVPLDAERRELVAESETLTLGIQGLTTELERIEDELSRAIEARNTRFSQLASTWLKREGAAFNDLTVKLQESARRLFAAKSLLEQTGDSETFAGTLGAGGSHLHRLTLPKLLNGFAPSDLTPDRQRGKLRPTSELCESVFSEVTR